MLQEIWEETGQKPDALVNRPELASRWTYAYVVWIELGGSRNYTAAGVAEIPFSEFYLWSRAHGYTQSELCSMWEDLHMFDKTWVEDCRKKAQTERDAAMEDQRRKNSMAKTRN